MRKETLKFKAVFFIFESILNVAKKFAKNLNQISESFSLSFYK